jgi:hypothetical protein
MVVAGVASAVAAPLAERAVAAVWRGAAGEDPPSDPADRDGRDVAWGRALAWTALSGLAVALAQVVARRGAGALWEQVTGARPPRARGRRRRLTALTRRAGSPALRSTAN